MDTQESLELYIHFDVFSTFLEKFAPYINRDL